MEELGSDPVHPTPAHVPLAGAKEQVHAEPFPAAAFSLGTWCLADDPDLGVFSVCPGMDKVGSSSEGRGQVRLCPTVYTQGFPASLLSQRVWGSALRCHWVPLAI